MNQTGILSAIKVIKIEPGMENICYSLNGFIFFCILLSLSLNFVVVFSSPEPKAQVSNGHPFSSVVRRA